MNTLKLNKLTYKFQNLLLQNKMPTLKNFKIKVCGDFFIPIEQLEKIYAFIETIQQHPKQYSLIHAFKYVFKWVLIDMISIGYSGKYLIEHIKELKSRPSLSFAKSDIVYKDTLNNDIISIDKKDIKIKIPNFYDKKEKFYLYIPLLDVMVKISWNIWCYFLSEKVFLLKLNDNQEGSNTAYFDKDIKKQAIIIDPYENENEILYFKSLIKRNRQNKRFTIYYSPLYEYPCIHF